MTDEEFAAAQAGLQFMLDCYADKQAWEGYPRKIRDGIAAITTLRAQLAEARVERDAMIPPDHVDGLIKLAEPMIYEALAAETARADRAEAALAAQIEADAGVAENYDETCPAFNWPSRIAGRIRAQPHSRTALQAAIRAAKVEAWKKAPNAGQCGNGHDCPDGQHGGCCAEWVVSHEAILALIEREGV